MKNKPFEVIIADMGATYSRVALLDEYQAIRHVKTYESNQFDSPSMVINAYLAEQALMVPDLVLIAVAAPIDQDRLNLTNIHWDFSQQAVAQELNTKVVFLNDFEALSMALDHISDSDLLPLTTNNHLPSMALTPQAKIVIGTGTGFGTAMALTLNGETKSFASEGGHSLYAPQDLIEIAIMQQLMDQLGRPIITEDILGCKEGITRLITILADLEGITLDFEPTPEALVVAACERESPFAIQVLNRYCMMLGNAASNLVLNTGATGGVYLGGGFAPRFGEFLQQSDFYSAFLNKAKVESLLENIPIYLITHPYATLVGLQHILPRYL